MCPAVVLHCCWTVPSPQHLHPQQQAGSIRSSCHPNQSGTGACRPCIIRSEPFDSVHGIQSAICPVTMWALPVCCRIRCSTILTPGTSMCWQLCRWGRSCWGTQATPDLARTGGSFQLLWNDPGCTISLQADAHAACMPREPPPVSTSTRHQASSAATGGGGCTQRMLLLALTAWWHIPAPLMIMQLVCWGG